MTNNTIFIGAKTIYTVILCGILVIASSCNNDVFLDEPGIPEQMQLTIEGDGGETEFSIPTKSLQRFSLYIFSEEQRNCTYYNDKGEVIDSKSPASQVGSIVYESLFCVLKIFKTGGVVKVKSVCNPSEYEGRWTIRLDYDYGVRFVNVVVLPGKPIKLVEVKYNSQLNVDDNAKVMTRSMGFTNNGSLPQILVVMPYLQAAASYEVSPHTKYSWACGQKVTMKVPIYNDGWKLEERSDFYPGNNYSYYRRDQMMEQNVDIPADSKVNVITDVVYSKAEIDGTMIFLNEVLGQYITEDFTATSYYPINYKIRVENAK